MSKFSDSLCDFIAMSDPDPARTGPHIFALRHIYGI